MPSAIQITTQKRDTLLAEIVKVDKGLFEAQAKLAAREEQRKEVVLTTDELAEQGRMLNEAQGEIQVLQGIIRAHEERREVLIADMTELMNKMGELRIDKKIADIRKAAHDYHHAMLTTVDKIQKLRKAYEAVPRSSKIGPTDVEIMSWAIDFAYRDILDTPMSGGFEQYADMDDMLDRKLGESTVNFEGSRVLSRHAEREGAWVLKELGSPEYMAGLQKYLNGKNAKAA